MNFLHLLFLIAITTGEVKAETIDKYVELAFKYRASTYGYGEIMCGDIGAPRRCKSGALTASGEVFNPYLPTAAVFAPTKLRMSARYVWMKMKGGPYNCRMIRVNDKGNPRFIGERGFDLTPGAVLLLGGTPSPTWGGRLERCSDD